MSDRQKHLIIISHGVEDGLRQILFGFQFALTIANMGVETSLFLTGLASRWAYKGVGTTIQGDEFIALKGYFDSFIEANGKILVCRSCYTEEYNLTDDENVDQTLSEGVNLVGLSVVAELAMESKVITF